MRAITRTALLALACALTLGTATAARADDTPTTDLPLTNSSSDTLFEIMGVPIVDFRASAGGMSPIDRCGVVQRRFKAISNTRLYQGDVSIAHSGSEVAIMLKGKLLFTACAEDARANNSTTIGLANEWGAHLRRAISLMGS